jgi:Ankyrin repeats (3 copies)
LLTESGIGCTSQAYQYAAGRYADIATFAVAHKMGMKYTATTMAVTAQCNKLAEVQYLHSQGCPWSSSLLERAANSGDFELLRWCYEQGCAWQSAAGAPRQAVQSGNVELMAWVLQLPGTQLSTYVMRAAALKGHTDICRYLLEQQCPWDTSATLQAACEGHVYLLRWLINSGCPWDVNGLRRSAAGGGSIDVLAYLQQQGLLTDTATLTEMLDTAAVCNQLAAAKWLREQGAEWPVAFNENPWVNEPWSPEVLAEQKAAQHLYHDAISKVCTGLYL